MALNPNVGEALTVTIAHYSKDIADNVTNNTGAAVAAPCPGSRQDLFGRQHDPRVPGVRWQHHLRLVHRVRPAERRAEPDAGFGGLRHEVVFRLHHDLRRGVAQEPRQGANARPDDGPCGERRAHAGEPHVGGHLRRRHRRRRQADRRPPAAGRDGPAGRRSRRHQPCDASNVAEPGGLRGDFGEHQAEDDGVVDQDLPKLGQGRSDPLRRRLLPLLLECPPGPAAILVAAHGADGLHVLEVQHGGRHPGWRS